ncbi:MAG: hypothetical protein MK135_12880, partial [Polyangiaceae bacterium]|nr:hypothetical protein [Polyangiaceae bacterium]
MVRAGRWESAKTQLSAEANRGVKFSRRDAESLALVSLKYEIEHAHIDRSQSLDDTNFIQSLRGCIGSAEPSLRRLGETQNEIGAEALLVLAEAGLLNERGAKKYLSSSDAVWRSVGATAAAELKPEERQKLYLDPEERVRRAAIQSIQADPPQEDLLPLFEVARRDPSPLIRSQAFRALA